MKKIKFMAKDRQTFDLHEPPIPAINGLPQWYKDIPAYKNTNQKIFGRNSSTVKQCLPLFDAMTAGYLVTLPCDIAVVRINGNQKVQWQPDMPLFDIENFERSHGIPVPLHHDPTIWRVVTYPVTIVPEGYSTFITGPINRFDLPFTVITGFVDSDTLHGALTVSLFFVSDFEGIIEKGTPIAQIIPIKRENWQHEIIEPDEKYLAQNSFNLLSKMNRSYKNQFWKKKMYN